MHRCLDMGVARARGRTSQCGPRQPNNLPSAPNAELFQRSSRAPRLQCAPRRSGPPPSPDAEQGSQFRVQFPPRGRPTATAPHPRRRSTGATAGAGCSPTEWTGTRRPRLARAAVTAGADSGAKIHAAATRGPDFLKGAEAPRISVRVPIVRPRTRPTSPADTDAEMRADRGPSSGRPNKCRASEQVRGSRSMKGSRRAGRRTNHAVRQPASRVGLVERDGRAPCLRAAREAGRVAPREL